MNTFGFGYMIIFPLFLLGLVKETETVLLIKMKCTRVIVCINPKESTSSLIVLVSKPVLQDVKNLSSYESALSLEILILTSSLKKYVFYN